MSRKKVAISLAGVLLSKSFWRRAHEKGMQELSELSGIEEVADKTDDPNYFSYVEKAIGKIYPDLSPEERIRKRRRIYFKRVLEAIKKSKIDCSKTRHFLEKLKEKFDIFLFTTSIESATEEILDFLGIKDYFLGIFSSLETEKDEKEKVLERMLAQIDKIDFLIENGTGLQDFCEKNNIRHFEFDIDKDSFDELLEELK